MAPTCQQVLRKLWRGRVPMTYCCNKKNLFMEVKAYVESLGLAFDPLLFSFPCLSPAPSRLSPAPSCLSPAPSCHHLSWRKYEMRGNQSHLLLAQKTSFNASTFWAARLSNNCGYSVTAWNWRVSFSFKHPSTQLSDSAFTNRAPLAHYSQQHAWTV